MYIIILNTIVITLIVTLLLMLLALKKNFLKKKKTPKIIIVTGVICVSKTTFIKSIIKYLTDQGKRIKTLTEVSMTLKDELKLFYNHEYSGNKSLFQYVIIEGYRRLMSEIKEKYNNYDYIVLDHSQLDTIVFTYVNILHKDTSEYLKNQAYSVEFPFEISHVIYLKSSMDIMVDRFEKRKSNGNDIDNSINYNYIGEIYEWYKTLIDVIYTKPLVIENNGEEDENKQIVQDIFQFEFENYK